MAGVSRRLGMTAISMTGASALLLTSGCGLIDKPDLMLSATSPISAGEGGRLVEVGILASNRNDFDLPLERVNYRAMIDGETIFEADRSPLTTIERLDRRSFTVPIVLPNDVSTDTVELVGTLYYRRPGPLADLLFDAGLRRPRLGFRLPLGSPADN